MWVSLFFVRSGLILFVLVFHVDPQRAVGLTRDLANSFPAGALVVLTALATFLCGVGVFYINQSKDLMFLILRLGVVSVIFFLKIKIVNFYIFFELRIIPIFLIVMG